MRASERPCCAARRWTTWSRLDECPPTSGTLGCTQSLRRANKCVAAHYLLVLLLVYAENELLSYGAALAWYPRKLQSATRSGRGTSLFLLEL
jgi:hypothetical protein